MPINNNSFTFYEFPMNYANTPDRLAIRPKIPSSPRGQDKIVLDHSKLERDPRTPTLRKGQKKARDSKRYVVRIVSFRTRLLDVDNLCEKFAVDFLRYCGAIPSDAPATTQITIEQKKTGKEEEDRDEITVIRIEE